LLTLTFAAFLIKNICLPQISGLPCSEAPIYQLTNGLVRDKTSRGKTLTATKTSRGKKRRTGKSDAPE